MKKITQEFTLWEIKTISEKIVQLLTQPSMVGGVGYKIAQWGKEFRSKGDDITERRNRIVLKHCNPGEVTVPMDKIKECTAELTEFDKIKDSVEFSQFNPSWIEGIVVGDIAILYQLMDEEKFKEQ